MLKTLKSSKTMSILLPFLQKEKSEPIFTVPLSLKTVFKMAQKCSRTTSTLRFFRHFRRVLKLNFTVKIDSHLILECFQNPVFCLKSRREAGEERSVLAVHEYQSLLLNHEIGQKIQVLKELYSKQRRMIRLTYL